MDRQETGHDQDIRDGGRDRGKEETQETEKETGFTTRRWKETQRKGRDMKHQWRGRREETRRTSETERKGRDASFDRQETGQKDDIRDGGRDRDMMHQFRGRREKTRSISETERQRRDAVDWR